MKRWLVAWVVSGAFVFIGCGPQRTIGGDDAPPEAGAEAPGCQLRCSDDLHTVRDCNNQVVATCAATEACDLGRRACTNACAAAESSHRSIGCDYYATQMETSKPENCFAVFIANTWSAPAKIAIEFDKPLPSVEMFARVPRGAGLGLTYDDYNPATGILPGEVAVLFLAGRADAPSPCPAPTATVTAHLDGSGIAAAFHITTDVPVVAYQINPYGGGFATAVAGASLLLPSSVWDTNYIAVNAAPDGGAPPSLNIIAKENDTIATITPRAAIAGGGAIPSGPAGQPLQIALRKGQHAQLTQPAELTGSIITANKPIGLMGGHRCMSIPNGASFCDHAEQMIPPVRALGHRYAGVMYRPRRPAETATRWRLIGIANGTQLTWSRDVGGPATLGFGQAVEFETGEPFVVSSQSKDYPFMLFTYMTSAQQVAPGYGDPDFVLTVPPEQYLNQYVFFADPTYPETNLVLVRTRGEDLQFHDVTLDCAGLVQGWQAIDSDHQWARVDLGTGNFQRVGNCSTGSHQIESAAPFGLWVWGWGSPETGTGPQDRNTTNVSYGYPGGMNVAPINPVVFSRTPPSPLDGARSSAAADPSPASPR